MEAGNGARSAYLARQRIFGAVVKLADGVAVETLFVHFEHGPEQQDRRHFFDREPDRFRRRIEAAIAGWAITLLAPAGKQLCRRLIVEAGHAVLKHSRGGKASQPRPQALRQSRGPVKPSTPVPLLTRRVPWLGVAKAELLGEDQRPPTAKPAADHGRAGVAGAARGHRGGPPAGEKPRRLGQQAG